MDEDYERLVRAYLSDCARAAAWLEARHSSLHPRFHPTLAGALKMIPHGGDAGKAAKIRAAYEAVTGGGEAAAA
jgi:hypothetical protein